MLQHLTVPRLATVNSFFKTISYKDTLGCYAWNQAVGAGLLPILGDFEVSLRNALHRALSQHFGQLNSYNWMMPRPNPARATNPRAPELLPPVHKLPTRSIEDIKTVILKVKSKKPRGYMVTPDDVVASLPFGFWEVLISGLGHRSQPNGLQAAILAAVFPFAPDTHNIPYGSPVFKKRIEDLLKRIRDVRNRIGHHDSLWTMPEFNRHGSLGFIPQRPRQTITSLRLFTENVCWFADWIDANISTYIRSSDHWWSLQALLHKQALITYRQFGGEAGTYRVILDSAELPLRTKTGSKSALSKFRDRLEAARYFY